jgi:hypothetical protein
LGAFASKPHHQPFPGLVKSLSEPDPTSFLGDNLRLLLGLAKPLIKAVMAHFIQSIFFISA